MLKTHITNPWFWGTDGCKVETLYSLCLCWMRLHPIGWGENSQAFSDLLERFPLLNPAAGGPNAHRHSVNVLSESSYRTPAVSGACRSCWEPSRSQLSVGHSSPAPLCSGPRSDFPYCGLIYNKSAMASPHSPLINEYGVLAIFLHEWGTHILIYSNVHVVLNIRRYTHVCEDLQLWMGEAQPVCWLRWWYIIKETS